ncbi:MAG: flagellar biosynthesis anti-sigma factor FlgM [Armatimonadetes bacterium]|nr:flagellar biosynthesis anti-sigma factor FlgM [Armatimonadota bacterium]
MKISKLESGKAAANAGPAESKILPGERPRGTVATRAGTQKQLSPLEKGMLVAEEALTNVPDIREDVVRELKDRIERGEYEICGAEVADMMLRRLAADRMR